MLVGRIVLQQAKRKRNETGQRKHSVVFQQIRSWFSSEGYSSFRQHTKGKWRKSSVALKGSSDLKAPAFRPGVPHCARGPRGLLAGFLFVVLQPSPPPPPPQSSVIGLPPSRFLKSERPISPIEKRGRGARGGTRKLK